MVELFKQSEKNNGYHIELADSIHGSRKLFKTAGLSSCNNEYDINLLRFCMAVISDGYLEIKGNCVAYRFNLKKERDKKELEDILSALHWNYTKIIVKVTKRMDAKVYTLIILTLLQDVKLSRLQAQIKDSFVVLIS